MHEIWRKNKFPDHELNNIIINEIINNNKLNSQWFSSFYIRPDGVGGNVIEFNVCASMKNVNFESFAVIQVRSLDI